MGDTSYVIKPRPPVRAFLIAALLALTGAFVFVLSLVYSWPVVFVVVGAVLLALGVLLTAVSLAAMKRQEVTLVLSDKGYQLRDAHGAEGGTWKAVTRVSQSRDGGIITIHERGDVRHHLVFSRGAMGDMDALIQDLTQRLDAAKGYRNF